MTASFDEMGKKFLTQGQQLKRVEWRTALEAPADVLAREARAADLIIVGPGDAAGNRHDAFDPGAVLLRAGRPILVVPDIFHPLALRRVVVAWKDTRECRRAVRDALPFLQQAKEVLIVEIGEDGSESDARKALSDVASLPCSSPGRRHRRGLAASRGDRPPPSFCILSRTSEGRLDRGRWLRAQPFG